MYTKLPIILCFIGLSSLCSPVRIIALHFPHYEKDSLHVLKRLVHHLTVTVTLYLWSLSQKTVQP
jgi:hypothetical protein